jgi:hypothetical protein
MNWKDDPQIRAEIKARGVRSRLLRSAILWTPLFLISLGAALFYLFDVILGGDHGGTWVLVIVLAILATLFGFQSLQSLLDLRSAPLETTGLVTRRWARNDSLVLRSHYVRIDSRILRGDHDLLANIKEGDYVETSYYQHSAVIVWIEKRPPPPGA